MKTFQEFISEAYSVLDEDAASYSRRQANKQARGRSGKTPLYVDKTTKKIERSPEGKLEVKKTTQKKMNPKAQVGRFKAGKHSWGPGIQGGGHGGAGMGYAPKPHSTGGVNRGKKKREQTKAPETKLNTFQRRREVERARHYRTGGETLYSNMIGGRAAQKLKDKASKSFGSWSKSKG